MAELGHHRDRNVEAEVYGLVTIRFPSRCLMNYWATWSGITLGPHLAGPGVELREGVSNLGRRSGRMVAGSATSRRYIVLAVLAFTVVAFVATYS